MAPVGWWSCEDEALATKSSTLLHIRELPLAPENQPVARGSYPNEASLLRLVTAVLVELSDDWKTGKMKYLVFQH
jgi:hypothetical protein